MTRKLRVGIVGLGFGAEFIPIYQAHPAAELVAVCQRSSDAVVEVADRFGIPGWYTDFEAMLADPDIEAVHINTPIGLHADHAVAALEAGKHVACTVPMGLSIDDCARVVRAQEASGKTYMMMETAVYTREFLFVKQLVDSGRLGRIQFLRGAHIQEMNGWPEYWKHLSPMQYATHAIGPLLALAGSHAALVRAVGSGHLDRIDVDGSGYAVASALFQLHDSDVAVEVTRSLFDVAREYVESFNVYGTKMTYEWQQLERDRPTVFEGESGAHVDVPDYASLLPEEIRRFTRAGVYDLENAHLSFTQGGGHGGSHPHLVHEFVTSVLDGRPPFPDVYTSANWTCAGICAHESAVGKCDVTIPDFRAAHRGRSPEQPVAAAH